VVGSIVRDRLSQGRDLGDLTLDELHRYHRSFESSAIDEARPERSLASRSSPGGTAPQRVREALAEATEALQQ